MKHADLDSLRKDVAQIDDAIIDLLIKRFDVTDEVGRLKKRAIFLSKILKWKRKTLKE
jgi:chorismate mutase